MEDIKKRLQQIVGSACVFDDEEVLSSYGKDSSFVKPMIPRFVVKVQNAKQVEELVALANKESLPLVPVSSAAPHYKGDTVPSVPEAIIVDLSGMKKILSINRTHRIAVIEPGVTYEELNDALKEHGMTISMCLTPRAGKSVVGSLLETEPRLNALHQWNNMDPLRCMEVTWGDGNRMYTGEAGGSVMNLEQQWKEEKWQWEPSGPMMFDFYRLLTGAQGTMGIVTWASIRCEIMPQIHKGYLVPAKNPDELIDFAYNVLRLRFSEEFFIMNKQQLASLMADKAEDVSALSAKLPPWVAVVGIVGRELLPEKRVSYQTADISEIAQKYGLQLLASIGGLSGDAVAKKATDSCAGQYWKEMSKGAFADIFFSTTLDQTPKFVKAMIALAEEGGYPLCDVGVYLQPDNMGSSCMCSFTLPYEAGSAKSAERTEKLFEKASKAFSDMGAYYYRPYGIWSRLQLNRDAQSYKVQQDLKSIFDPNGIMNPGKLCNC